jgi:hypothetical protein
MRLIDADLLIEEINKVYVVEEKEDLKWAKGLHYVKAIIRDMPTIETDASAMLKEQDAKPQRYEENDIFHLPLCPREHCNAVIKKEWHYCPYCKQPIQWDDDLDEKVNMEGR